MTMRQPAAVWTPAHQAVAAAVAVAAGVPQPRSPAGPVDWSGFADLVSRHRVAPLVHRSGVLPQLGAPAEVIATVGRQSRRAAARSLSHLAVLAELSAALHAARIGFLVFKGIPLASHAYGDPAARDAGDLDILVEAGQVTEAVRLLGSLGFEIPTLPGLWTRDQVERALPVVERLPALHEIPLRRAGVVVDLHWRLFSNSRVLPVDPAWLRRPMVARVGPVSLPVLPAEQQWRLVVLHGAKHSWSRLQWLADVAALVALDPGLPCRSRRGGQRSCASALRLAERVLGSFLSEADRQWVVDVPGAAFLERRGLSFLVGSATAQLTPGRMPGEVRSRMALGSGRAFRREELRRLLIEGGRRQLVPEPGIRPLATGAAGWLLRSIGRRTSQRRTTWAGLPLIRRLPVRQVGTLIGLPGWHRWRLFEATLELTRASVQIGLTRPARMARLLGEPEPTPAAARAPGRALATGPADSDPVPPRSPADPADPRAPGPASDGIPRCGTVSEATRLGRDVSRVARSLPWRPTCLRQALAVARMLRRRGVPSRVHLGVARPDGGLTAHAWVTVDDLVVSGRAGQAGHTALASFVTPPLGGRRWRPRGPR